jgi:hypothetical protein
MIMVRQNELACRDEWSRSLWAPGEGAGEAEKSFQRPPLLGPAPPANVEHVRKMLVDNAMDALPSTQGEDVLLSEARIVSEVLESPALKERPVHSGGFDPRTAVFRAREAYRERARARESAARHSAGLEAIGARQELEETVDTSDSGEPYVTVTVTEAEEAVAEAVFQTAERPPTELTHHEQRQRFYEPVSRAEANGVARGQDLPKATPADAAIVTGDEEDRWRTIETPIASEREPVLALTRLSELDETNLPEWFRTDLPRTCRTCRDFRPSADGGRGWCANAWAFTHRRLVQEDDVAPCDSSIGDWWAAVDDVWLVAADVSSHGLATPLLDRLHAPQTERRRRS